MFTHSVINTLLYIALTILATVVINYILRSFITLPKRLDNRRGRTYINTLRNTISVVVFAITLQIILSFLNINVAPVLASAGIVGLSIGLGAKSLIEDLIGGLTLISQNSISIGDFVQIDDSVGRVENIGLRTLSIRAKDGSLHIIPNGMVKKVINYSRKIPAPSTHASKKA
jgi:small-conductance mechanosensitive channel